MATTPVDRRVLVYGMCWRMCWRALRAYSGGSRLAVVKTQDVNNTLNVALGVHDGCPSTLSGSAGREQNLTTFQFFLFVSLIFWVNLQRRVTPSVENAPCIIIIVIIIIIIINHHRRHSRSRSSSPSSIGPGYGVCRHAGSPLTVLGMRVTPLGNIWRGTNTQRHTSCTRGSTAERGMQGTGRDDDTQTSNSRAVLTLMAASSETCGKMKQSSGAFQCAGVATSYNVVS